MDSESPGERRRAWHGLRWWHWLFVVVVVLFWTVGSAWADSAAHFGFKLWPLLAVMFLIFISPIVAVVDLYRSSSALQRGEITREALWLRRAWAAALIINWTVIAYQMAMLSSR